MIFSINEKVVFHDSSCNQQTVSLKFKPHPILELPCVTTVRRNIHISMVESRISFSGSSCQVYFRTDVGYLCTIQMTTPLTNGKCYLSCHKQTSVVSKIMVLQDVNILISRGCYVTWKRGMKVTDEIKVANNLEKRAYSGLSR